MKKNEKKNIIIESLVKNFIEGDWNILNKSTLIHLIYNANIENISDEVIASNEIIYKNINFDNISKEKLIRIITRNIDIAKYIDIKNRHFTINDIKYFLKTYPNMVDVFNINLKTISKKEAYILLKLNVERYFEEINIKNYDFNAIENYEILKSANFKEKVFHMLDTDKLKNYHIVDIVKHTGEQYIKYINLKKLTPRKWCDLLTYQPNLLKYCDINVFRKGDIFNIIQLIEIYEKPNFSYLIKEIKNYRDLISPLGWEKLIISKPEDFINDCLCYKLNANNWKNILRYHPELIAYKT